MKSSLQQWKPTRQKYTQKCSFGTLLNHSIKLRYPWKAFLCFWTAFWSWAEARNSDSSRFALFFLFQSVCLSVCAQATGHIAFLSGNIILGTNGEGGGYGICTFAAREFKPGAVIRDSAVWLFILILIFKLKECSPRLCMFLDGINFLMAKNVFCLLKVLKYCVWLCQYRLDLREWQHPHTITCVSSLHCAYVFVCGCAFVNLVGTTTFYRQNNTD